MDKYNVYPWCKYIAFGFGSGLSPKAPGTFGSLISLLFMPIISLLNPYMYVLLILILTLAAVVICDIVAKHMQVDDPKEIVIDEFIGIWVSLFLSTHAWQWIIGFIFFRIFDIKKPLIIGWIDKKVHGGIGIVLDDFVAGMLTCITVQFITLLT